MQTLQYGRLVYSGATRKNITACLPFFSIDNKYPFLKNLTVYEERINLKCKETFYDQICTVIRLNPQLRALLLRFVPNLNIIQFARDNLRKLEKLEVTIDDKLGHILHGETFHFKNVKSFHLYNELYVIENPDVKYEFSSKFDFPFTFDRLEHFSANFYGIFESTDAIHNFFRQNRSIVKLSLSDEDLSKVNVTELADMLPLLVDLEILGILRTVKKAIYFAEQIKTLRTITVSYLRQLHLDYVESNLGWKGKILNYIYCKQRMRVQFFKPIN